MSRLWEIKCSDWNGSSGMCLLRPLKMQIRNFGLLVCRDVLWDGSRSELVVCRDEVVRFWSGLSQVTVECFLSSLC